VNPNGTTTTLIAGLTNGQNPELSYSYDALGNITEVYEGSTLQARYTYDALSQLVRVDDAVLQTTLTYTYDTGGNLLTATTYAYTTAPVPTNPTGSVSYSYSDNSWGDLLTGVTTSGSTPFNTFTPTYDAIGNPLSWRNGMTMSWTRGRRLNSITSTSLNASYVYNDSGIRTSKTVNGVTTTYVISGTAILRQSSPAGTLDFMYDGSKAIGFVKDSVNYWYVYNLQGDIIAIINDSGAEVVSYTYDSWGRVVSVTGSMANTIGAANPFRYRGYYYDTETGLYYLNTRYYDPAVGRFLNLDGLFSTGQGVLGFNMFAYCANNPATYTDAFGTKHDVSGGRDENPNPIASLLREVAVMLATSKPSASTLSLTVSYTWQDLAIDFDGEGTLDDAINSSSTSFIYEQSGRSLNAYDVPYIALSNTDEYSQYLGCIVLVWDNDKGYGFYAVFGDLGTPAGMGEVSVGLGQKFRPGDPFINPNTGQDYGLDGNYTFYIIPNSDIRGRATPDSINDVIKSDGRKYFGYVEPR
jgi:RHS repeat-associated protein